MKKWRKYFYLALTTALTSTTVSAAYWQTSRYFQSNKRWKIIAKELSNENPPQIAETSELSAFKYLSIKGQLSESYVLISRARQSRMGYLIVKPLYYMKQGQRMCILAVEGWIPEDFQYKSTKKQKNFHGILREKEKKDYLHSKMKEKDLERFKMNTYIDVDKTKNELNIQSDELTVENFYFQILKDPKTSEEHHYPYQYSVDNFQLPYLTPDKHRAYATFWSMTSMVGLTAIWKVLKMKF